MQSIFTPFALKLVEFAGFSKITFDTLIKMLFHMKTLKEHELPWWPTG